MSGQRTSSTDVVSSTTSRVVAVRSVAPPAAASSSSGGQSVIAMPVNLASEEQGRRQQQQQQQPDQVVATTGFSDEDDEDMASEEDEEEAAFDQEDGVEVQPEIASQLASAGPTGMAAAAAISSTKKRKRSHSFETNPSIRKRQQTRLLRKLKANIEEYSQRVGQQAVVVVATPGKTSNSFRAFGAKPLEDVMRGLQAVVMTELENALESQAPPIRDEDPDRHELPALVIDGIPTPVEKMTQAQLRAFIPMMLKYSTGRGKPGWGKESTRPPWWPEGVPWANVRMDARMDDEKQRVSWTHALRQIVINCYRYHCREDLLPTFADNDENEVVVSPSSGVSVNAPLPPPPGSKAKLTVSGGVKRRAPSPGTLVAVQQGEVKKLVAVAPSSQQQQQPGSHFLVPSSSSASASAATLQLPSNSTVVQTITNPDGTVSIVQLDASSVAPGTIIQLADGTTAQIGCASEAVGQQQATGVHTLAEVASAVSAHNQQQQVCFYILLDQFTYVCGCHNLLHYD